MFPCSNFGLPSSSGLCHVCLRRCVWARLFSVPALCLWYNLLCSRGLLLLWLSDQASRQICQGALEAVYLGFRRYAQKVILKWQLLKNWFNIFYFFMFLKSILLSFILLLTNWSRRSQELPHTFQQTLKKADQAGILWLASQNPLLNMLFISNPVSPQDQQSEAHETSLQQAPNCWLLIWRSMFCNDKHV